MSGMLSGDIAPHHVFVPMIVPGRAVAGIPAAGNWWQLKPQRPAPNHSGSHAASAHVLVV